MSKAATKAVKYAKPSAKLLNSRLKQEQDVKTERNKLALASVKDIFSILNPNSGSDEDFDLTDFDCKRYFANPREFQKLPFFKQQHVIDEMNEKLKKNWKSLDKDIKRFSVWWAYGSTGPREGFIELHDYQSSYDNDEKPDLTKESMKNDDNNGEIVKTELDDLIDKISKETVNQSSDKSKDALQMSNSTLDTASLNTRPEVPPDLPFKLPSVLKTVKPRRDTPVKKLPTLDPRSFGLKRLQQYRQDRMMNPINKIVIVLTIFLTVLCFKQDRRVNVTGVVPEYPWEVAEREEREEAEKIQREKEAEEERKRIVAEEELKRMNKNNRKWYFLWLK